MERFILYNIAHIGRECWDHVSVWSCFGRCDSNEISDWKFPYKRSYHPVCMHAGRSKAVAMLRNCHPQASPETRYIKFSPIFHLFFSGNSTLFFDIQNSNYSTTTWLKNVTFFQAIRIYGGNRMSLSGIKLGWFSCKYFESIDFRFVFTFFLKTCSTTDTSCEAPNNFRDETSVKVLALGGCYWI